MKKGSSGDDVLGIGSDDDHDQDDVDEIEDDPDPATDILEEPTGESGTVIVPEPPQAGSDASGVPWVYTRANVKQDRDMVQFYLREFVQDAEDDLVDAVAEQLGTDVSKTDVREAAYVAAMREPEIVAAELERWGFESE